MVARASSAQRRWDGAGLVPRALADLALIAPPLVAGVGGAWDGIWALPALAALWMVAAATGGALAVGVGDVARRGVLAGLVAALTALACGWLGPATPALVALTVAAGWLGGALGSLRRSRGDRGRDA